MVLVEGVKLDPVGTEEALHKVGGFLIDHEHSGETIGVDYFDALAKDNAQMVAQRTVFYLFHALTIHRVQSC